jgi:predicted nucleic acid-binding protein
MTEPPPQGVLDTTVLIANESGRALNVAALPDESAISVVTLAELHAGVLAAKDVETRARRLATVDKLAAAGIEVLPVDESVAITWARMRVLLAESGRRVNVNDLWIAATAAARGLPVVTQDSDFDPLDGMAGLRIVRV